MISFPNAKINLGLHVIRKRDDGFHDIETVFFPIQMHDSLEILVKPGETSITQHGPALPDGENIVTKAYELLKSEYGIPAVDIHLLKHIPTGAGLGGGSSDAAHTLLMLNDLFRLNISSAGLEALAAKLGSDCPFFMRNKPVFASGRGEVFEEIDPDLSGYEIRVVKPDVHISTVEAYGFVKPNAERPSLREIIRQPLSDWKDNLINDFEKPVFEKYPEIREVKESMYDQGAVYASMSGSGSAVYGLFAAEE